MWDIWSVMDYESKVAGTMSVQVNQNEVVNGSEGEFKTLPRLKKYKQPVPLDLSTSSVDTSTDKLEEPPKKRKYIKKSKFWLQKKKRKSVFKCRNKVTPSNPNSSPYIASSSQLLDHSTGQPVHLNSENVNNVPFQQDNNVEQDSHLDASSEGGGLTVTSVTLNTSQDSGQEKDSSCQIQVPQSEMNMKNVSICLKRVDQTKINATSKKNLEVMHKLKTEKDHLLKKVQ